MVFLVTIAVIFACEVLSAHTTRERFYALVRPEIGIQVEAAGVLLLTQVALKGRWSLRGARRLWLRGWWVLLAIKFVNLVPVEDMFLQLVFRRTAEKFHLAAVEDAEEWTIMPVNMILLLTCAFKPLMIVMAADAGAFEPISAVELLKFPLLSLR